MVIRLGATCCSLLLVAAALQPVAAHDSKEDPLGWFERMTDAVATRSYHGTLLFRQGDRQETIEIVHQWQDDEEHERLTAQSGDQREVVRSGGRFHCHNRGTGTLIDTPALPTPTDQGGHHQRLTSFYHLGLNSGERVAGRQSRVLEIVPRDHYRYGYRVWLDEESAVPLKSQLVDHQQSVIEEMTFTRIGIEVPMPGDALAPQTASASTNAELLATATSFDQPRGWRYEMIPGFEPVIDTHFSHPQSGHPVEHRIYSDGLATLSIFAERRSVTAGTADDAVSHHGGVSQGAVHARSSLKPPYLFTIVGDVPRHTVDRLIEGIVLEGGGG